MEEGRQYSLDGGAVSTVDPLAVDVEAERDGNLPLEDRGVELVRERLWHGVVATAIAMAAVVVVVRRGREPGGRWEATDATWQGIYTYSAKKGGEGRRSLPRLLIILYHGIHLAKSVPRNTRSSQGQAVRIRDRAWSAARGRECEWRWVTATGRPCVLCLGSRIDEIEGMFRW